MSLNRTVIGISYLRLLRELPQVFEGVWPADVQVERVDVLLNRFARAADLLCQLLMNGEVKRVNQFYVSRTVHTWETTNGYKPTMRSSV